MSADSHSTIHRGGLAATAAGLAWGVVPIYWKQMQEVSAVELIAHRVVWSLLFLVGVMAWRRSLSGLRAGFTDSSTLISGLASSVLIAVNWIIFVWAVNTGHVIESSLGYFLTPLCNVALGFVFLHERLRTVQWAAVAFAAGGVALLLFHTGHIPWIALGIAGSWSLYGLLKKRSALGSIAGLTFETLVLFPLAGAYLLWLEHMDEGVLGHANLQLHALVLGLGVITAIPLLLFAYGARRLRFVTLGLLQYIAPTAQFLLGLLVYHEPFDTARLQACVLIWCGLVIYTADSFWTQRNKFQPATEPT